jgi:hypothetical protein
MTKASPPSGFEEFWKIYPRKVAKLKAEKLYAAIIKTKRAAAGELLDGAMRYAAERANEDPKYTRHASTWLNGGCWADDPKPPSSPTKITQADTAISGFNRFLNRNTPQ